MIEYVINGRTGAISIQNGNQGRIPWVFLFKSWILSQANGKSIFGIVAIL